MRHGHLNAPVHRPAFQRADPRLQLLMPLRVMRQRLEFGDQRQHGPGAFADVVMDGFGRIQHEILGQIAGHQPALLADHPAIGRLQAREQFQKGRLAAAVAADQANAVALLNAERD